MYINNRQKIKTSPRGDRFWQAGLLALLAAYILVFCLINFLGFGNFLHPDMYSDTLAAKYMWETKSLFPENWVFGNQYYVIATPAIAALFYGLTGNLNLSMALATTAETVALLAAVYWLFRSLLGKTQALIGPVALVSAVLTVDLAHRKEAQLLFVLASYYSCYLLTAVVVWGDYLQGLVQKKRLLCVSFFLSLTLSFATGMQSIRQTCIMTLPLLAFEGLRLLSRCLRRQTINWKPTIRAAWVAVANLGGVFLMHLLHIPATHIFGGDSLVGPGELPERFRLLAEAVWKITGFSYAGDYGLKYALFIFLFSLICTMTVLLALGITAARLRTRISGQEEKEGIDALNLLCLLSFLAVCASFLLVNVSAASTYLFMWYFWVCVSAVLVIDSLDGKKRFLALALLCVVSVANLRFSHASSVLDSLHPGISNFRAAYAEAAAALMDTDVEILYGPWSDTGKLCYYTNGEIVAVPWNKTPFQQLGYICPQGMIKPEDNQRAAYLILDTELPEAQRFAERQGAELTLLQRVKVNESYFFGLYTSSAQLMRPPEPAS